MIPATTKHLIIAAAVVAVICIAPSANATPGRTNAKGCHHSKKAGYHCHGTAKAPTKKSKSKRK